MLSKPSHRHPLYNRLARPIPAIFPNAVMPVAWDDDQPIEKAEGVAYVISRPSHQVRIWVRQLRSLHQIDRTYEVDEGISRLSAEPLKASELKGLGIAELEIYGRRNRTVRTAKAGQWVFLAMPLMTIVLDRVAGNAIGFVSFRLKWSIRVDDQATDEIGYEVDLGQAWIAPAFRRRRWGELAVMSIAVAACRHVEQLALSTRWPAGFYASLHVTVGADIYSQSGDALLRRCAEHVLMELDSSTNLARLNLTAVQLEPRW